MILGLTLLLLLPDLLLVLLVCTRGARRVARGWSRRGQLCIESTQGKTGVGELPRRCAIVPSTSK